jgi:hypothetical protein
MLLLAALASLAVAASALGSAAHSTASNPSLHVQPGTVKAGGVVHVYGRAGSCAAGSKLKAMSSAFPEYTFGVGALVGRVHANHTYSFRGPVRGSAPAGSYAVTARCGNEDLGVVAHVHVK